MKTSLKKLCFRSLSPILAACLLSCGVEQKVTTTPSNKEKFDASTNKFLDLWNAGDAESLSMLFAEDSVRVVSNDGQLPSVGRKAIAASFKEGFRKFKTSPDNLLNTKISSMVELEGGIIMAHGTFTIAGEGGFNGKWASIERNTEDGIEILMESAHVTESSLAAPIDFASVERVPNPDVTDYAAKFEEAMNRIITNYTKGATTGDAALIASTFTPDGIQIVSRQNEALHGRTAIEEAISASFSADDYTPGTLSAKTLRMRKVTDSLLIANGTWQVADKEGQITRFGQWGNIFEIQEDGSLLMKVECAGAFVPAP
jgi:uncharacterized protein (TIGR02246 family)